MRRKCREEFMIVWVRRDGVGSIRLRGKKRLEEELLGFVDVLDME